MKWYENKLINKLFLTTCDWNVAWKPRDESAYSIINNPEGYWLADPLLFETGKDIFLFVECFEKKNGIGRLGVMRFDGESFIEFTVIVKQPYHLSYPYVFSCCDKFYMIPESSSNETVELYKAIEFPLKWEKNAELARGKYVDTTLYPKTNGLFHLYTYDMNSHELCIGTLDMCRLKIEFGKRIKDEKYEFRNGGTVFEYSGQKCRAVQNNQYFYGQSLHVIDCDSNEELFDILPKKIRVNTNNRYRRIHTYSCTHDIEAVDLSDIKFDVFKCFKKVVRF